MMLLTVKLQKKMSKKKSSSNEKDDEKKIDDSEEKESSSIPLEDYEKIKDDYLRLAADFDNFKKRTEKDKENQLVGFCRLVALSNSTWM